MRIFDTLSVIAKRFRGRIVSLEVAREVLGEHSVIVPASVKDTETMYSRAYFEYTAAENTKGEEWVLVYNIDMSMWKTHEAYPNAFSHASVWDTHPTWLDEKLKKGFRLINLKGVKSEKLDQRIAELKKKGIECAPAKIGTITQALIEMERTQGTSKSKTRYFCGEVVAAQITPVIGGHDKEGLLLYSLPFDIGSPAQCPKIGVVLCIIPLRGLIQLKAPTT
ncbi:hypothetical protein H0W32_00825 [Patescibacteria group bacterium]|nr:hypothetical protein [Patescibacteria group bacterium]